MKAELVLGNLKRECEALDGKLERLYNALCKEWQDEDQEYLCTQQYNAMSLYAHILDERILDIEYKLAKKKAKSEETSLHEKSHADDDIFNKKVKVESCKDYMRNDINNSHQCGKPCDDEDVIVIIKRLIKDVFGEDND